MKISSPKHVRDSLNLFVYYKSELDITEIFEEIDWRDVTPVQIYYALLDRCPERLSVAKASQDYCPRSHYLDVLYSDEFQSSIVWNVLNAFSEKRRLIFVHIPKCAGSDLAAQISKNTPTVTQRITNPDWASKAELFCAIRQLVVNSVVSDNIFVSGHYTLNELIGRRACRYGDEIFTVVRDPIDRAISNINYATSIIAGVSSGLLDYPAWSSIAAETIQYLGKDHVDLIKLAKTIMHDKRIITPNAICNCLGDGDAASAMDKIAGSNIEITDTTRYNEWIKNRWGAERSERLNASESVLTRDKLTSDDLEYLAAIFSEDIIIYQAISKQLYRSNEPSIRGSNLDG